jgi:hypothetical protein
MKARKFPKSLYVTVNEDKNDLWYLAREKASDVIEDDGPTRVACYKLVDVQELTKRVVSKQSK